jgi:hypothetical protein
MQASVPAISRNGTDGRVYGGDPNLIHVPDGKRADLGAALATDLDRLMRVGAQNRTLHEQATQRLCPGCYMVVAYDMLVTLALRNGQPLPELARAMRDAFDRLLQDSSDPLMEEILILMDPEGSA